MGTKPYYYSWINAEPSEKKKHINTGNKLPSDFHGVLYRSGPALFERNGQKKSYFVDGDGMIHSFAFDGNNICYTSRFVQTKKFVEESRKKEFIYDTWTFQAGQSEFDEVEPPKYESQAYIASVFHHKKLFAFDESFSPYELDPDSLETIGRSTLGLLDPQAEFSAHSKIHTFQNQWLHFGLKHGKQAEVYFTILDNEGRLLNSFSQILPRAVYVHDFFTTENYIVMCLHPAFIRIQSVLAGTRSFIDSIKWHPEEGNLIVVYHKSGKEAPKYYDAQARWWLHSVNAWEDHDKIVMDFVGHSSPDHLMGTSPMYKNALTGTADGPYAPGEIWRYEININNRNLHETRLFEGNYEFPTVHPDRVGLKNKFSYMVKGNTQNPFWNTVVQVDMETGIQQEHCFGEGIYCSEPILAPTMQGVIFGLNESVGLLMSLIHDGINKCNYLAIFRSGEINQGPLTLVHIENEIPLTFHGCWRKTMNKELSK